MPILPSQNKELFDLLRDGGFLTPQELEEIEKYCDKSGKKVSQAVTELAILPDDQIAMLMADLERVPYIRVRNVRIEKEVLDLIPAKIAKENFIVPIKVVDDALYVATNNLHQDELFQFLEKKTKKKLKVLFAGKSEIKDALRVYEIPLQEKLEQTKKNIETKGEKEAAENITNLLNDIIYYAALEHASDIHIEPQASEIVVRVRLDGVLKDIMFLPKEFEDVVVTRIKVLANLRTDEHRSSQDGRIKLDFEEMSVTLRVSIIPIYDGEKVVLRLLATQGFLNLESLGYSQSHLNMLRESIQKSHGLILVTGPTGSGKTTSLYSLLRILNNRDVNISTIEDPVEIRLPGTNQIQVNNEANLTFASGLRSILRQDPDIILVGEIRDAETANIAINSALTGHLVLATLHTNDAASSLPRLLEMGIEHFLVASTVNGIVAQRLVRKNCPSCIHTKEIPLKKFLDMFDSFENFNREIFLQHLGASKKGDMVNLYEGKGCNHCNHTGFRGRLAIAEILGVDEAIRQLIKVKALPSEIVKAGRKKGMITMMEDGLHKVLQGLTTAEEVLRATRE